MSSTTLVTNHRLTTATWVAIALVVFGALNWGAVGLFNVNVVAGIFGPSSSVSRLIYALVALAGIYLLGVAPRLRQYPASQRPLTPRAVR